MASSDYLGSTLKELGIILALGLLGLLGVDTMSTVSSNAPVIAEPADSVYHASPAIRARIAAPITFADLREIGIEAPVRMTVHEARDRGFEGCEYSVEGGYFIQDNGMALWWVLEQTTGWDPWGDRWNDDGSWNW